MATMKTEITAIVNRCRKVKWIVETGSSGGWKITAPGHAPYLLHSSYSDRNAVDNVVRHLKTMGLERAERAAAVAREKQRADRLAAGQKQAADKALTLAKQAQLTAKAAGPYAGPEVVPLAWFVSEHPAPWMRWVVIDPPLARELLKRNVDNRPMLPALLAYYRDQIAAGRWHLTHQGMAMDTRQVLQDGQHRLQACVDVDITIEVPFFVGMPPENFKAIDEGRNRSIADLLGKEDVPDRNVVGTAVRLVAAYREPFPRNFLKHRTPNEVLFDAFKGDPVRLTEAVRWGRQNSTPAGIVASALSAAVYLLRDANGRDNQFVQAFFNGLSSGTKGSSRLLLDIDDPRLILREDMRLRRHAGRRMRAVDQLGYVLLAWNLIVDSAQQGRRIKWDGDGRDQIPQIVVCKDKGRTASALPDKLRGEVGG